MILGDSAMNVLIAANYGAPKSGNFVASLIALGRRLRKDGNNAYFVFPKQTDWISWFEREGFTAEVYDFESRSTDEQFAKVTELVEKYGIDIIHTHFGMFRPAIVKNRSKIKNVKILVHDHMGYYVDHSVFLQRIGFALLSAEYAFKKIRVAAVQKKKTDAYLFLPKKWYVPNGLSLERNVLHSMTREECRAELGLAPEEKVCFILGWDLKRKGLDTALKAVKKCREKDESIVLGIIGAGEGAPTDFAKDFIKNEGGFDPNEPWIRYFNNFEDMFAVHRAIDVYLSTSRQEGFPYGILEAISQDSPIVASDIVSQLWASEYTNCHFYPVEDPDKCAEAILDALAQGRCETNSAQIIDRYSVDRWCDKIVSIYNEL